MKWFIILYLLVSVVYRIYYNLFHFSSFPLYSTVLPDGRATTSPDSLSLRVLAEPWPIIHNNSLESSIKNRIVALENANTIFLLDKERGVYWSEIKGALDQAPSQREYNQLLDFENRDLRIRELKHECYSLF